MKTSTIALVATLLLAPAQAQTMQLSKQGGAVGEPTRLTLEGSAGTPYLLLYAFAEESTKVNSHTTLDIPLTFLGIAVHVPGFFGVVDGDGVIDATFVLPKADAALLDATLSCQAIGGECADQSSNLVRVTPALPGTFEATLGAPLFPIVGGVAARQDDGRVLLAGGSGPLAQSYDPDLEEFDDAGLAFGVGLLSQSTVLADGRILFTGGVGTDGQPTAAAAIFNPATGTSTELAMTSPRAGHGASSMPDGRVLITGGLQSVDLADLATFVAGVLPTSELFDPATGSFVAGPIMLEPRALHTQTTLAGGSVLVAGGLSIVPIVNLPIVSNTAYLYNPALSTFGLPQFFDGPRLLHSAVALEDGRALLVGGITLDLAGILKSGDLADLAVDTLDDVQVYSPGLFGNFSTVAGLSSGRAGAGVVALPDGSALIAGGFRVTVSAEELDFALLDAADRFLPAGGGSLIATGALGEPRALPLLVTLDDGTVLVVGGSALTAEVYQP